jgi:hypothetical protein
MVPLWESFFILHRSRTSGMQENSLEVSEIRSVWQLLEPMPDETRFVLAVQELDMIYLEHVNKRREERQQANKRKAGAKMLRKK